VEMLPSRGLEFDLCARNRNFTRVGHVVGANCVDLHLKGDF